MVTLTEDAEEAIRHLIDHAELPQVTGMRLSSEGEGDSLQLSLVAGPEQGDREIEARVPFYVEPVLAEELDGRALDADIDTEQGTVSFSLVEA